MVAIVGLVVLMICVFGGFIIAGGSLAPIIKAAPYEMFIIGGAGIGGMITGNSGVILKGAFGGFGRVIKGPKYKKEDYLAVMLLVAKIMKTLKTEGAVALEAHIENPEASAIFGEHPPILHDHDLLDLICNTVRLMVVSSSNLSPYAVEDVMDAAIKLHHHNELKYSGALATLAGALPALGIVACVLGVVKTMGAIDQPPPVLGGLIGSALVGTFLGILLAYAFAEPLAGLLEQKVEEAGKELQCIKTTLLASMQGYNPSTAIEFGRKVLYSTERPSFTELETFVKKK